MDATALRSNMLRGPAKKKTVTFQDLSGSENEMLEEEETYAGRKKTAAKPVRKTPGRGRKPVAPKSPAKPLSPKKANQVTKSLSSYAGSDGEDDELFTGKPTIASPAKRVSGKTGLSSPVKRINLTPGRTRLTKTVDENGDPIRRSLDFNEITTTVSSPNREPSPSPFHYTLRETPRRVAFEPRDSTHTQPLVQPNFGASSQGSPLKASPRKAPVGTPRGAGFGLRDDVGPLSQPNFTPGANSPLKSSPKKGRFGNSFNNTTSQPDFTPAQSFSPLKSSPKKGNLGASFTSQNAMLQSSSMPAFNPRISFLQSLAKKPASPFKSSINTPLAFKSSLLGQAESITPDAESTLHAGDLGGIEEGIEMEQEDSEDELTMDNRYNHSSRPDEVDEMDEVSVVGDNDYGHEHEHGYEYEEHMAAGTEAQEEFSLDLGEELAETFSVKDDAQIEDTMRNLEAEVNEEDVDGLVQDVLHDFVGYMDGPQRGFEHEREHEHEPEPEPELETELELEPASEPGYEHHDTHEMHAEEVEYSSELEVEPTSEANVEHTFDHIEQRGYSSQHDEPEPESEFEPEVEQLTSEPNIEHRDTPEYSSESELASEPNAEHTFDHMNHLNRMKEPEYSPERDEPESETEVEPTSEPNVEHDTCGIHMEEQEYSSEVESQQELPQHLTSEMDYIEQDDSDDMEMIEPTIEHDVRSEDYDGSDEGFDDDGTTLVDLDATQQYAEDARSPSPQAIELEREPTPEQVREFRDVGVQFPSPTAPRAATPKAATPKENNYREPMDQQVESDEEVQSEAPQSSVQKRLSHGRQSLFANTPGFSPLTQQFSEWKAATPEGSHPRRPRRGIFSLGDKPRRPSSRLSAGSAVSRQSIPRQSLASRKSLAEVEEPETQMEPETLEDDFAKTHEAQPEIFTDPEPGSESEPEAQPEIPSADVPVSHSIPAQDASPTRSIASVQGEFDDEKENQVAPSSPAVEPAPATPMKTIEPPQTFHTVSKVPLKPEGHISPLKMPLKRARSLSNASPTRASPRLRASFLLSQEDESDAPTFSPRKSPRMDQSPTRRPQRRSSIHSPRSVERRQSQSQSQNKLTKLPSRSPSPTKSPRKSIATSQALQGAVVYVDVHTTEGEDASGIFVELLQQMGARCVKNWSWNPRASFVPEQGTDPKDGKIGISHVVYKDGGVRTLEKVRSARGLVKCVGVGWVLDCERENQWLDEAQYTVDSSIVPRGGGKRRKSMEPRALSNVNGTLVSTPTMDRRRSGYSPAAGAQTPTSTRKYGQTQTQTQTPATPGYRFNMDDYAGMSPATPFYLSRAKLVQQTCPPKQTRQGLFPASSVSKSKTQTHADSPVLDDAESSKALRLKLEAARRKSMAYKPRRESPLVQ